MRRSMLPLALCLMICGVPVPGARAASQVVTQEVRDWAKKTLQEEKSVAGATTKNALSILYFINRTGKSAVDPLQKGMTLMLITDLSQVKGLQLVERVKLQAIAEELGLGSSGLVDQPSAPRIGRLLGARWIVGGDFIGLKGEKGESKGESFDTQSRFLEVWSSELSKEFSAQGGTVEGILETEKALAFSIVGQLKIKLDAETAAKMRKPCSTNPKALDALFRGIDASDHGAYQQAGELYQEALKADPDVCAAALALQELIRMDGYSERGTSQRDKKKAAAGINPESTTSVTATETPSSATTETPSVDTATDSAAFVTASEAPSSGAVTETYGTATGTPSPRAPSAATDMSSALAETALWVSGVTSLTNPITRKETIRNTNIVPLATTSVTIRVIFP